MGKHWTLKSKNVDFIKKRQAGSGNSNWKGDEVKYGGLHWWVKQNLPKSEFCDFCKLVPPRDLANKGIYDRNITNWEWLCRKCHMIKDGRLNRLAENSLKASLSNPGYKIRGYISCNVCNISLKMTHQGQKFCSYSCALKGKTWRGRFSKPLRS